MPKSVAVVVARSVTLIFSIIHYLLVGLRRLGMTIAIGSDSTAVEFHSNHITNSVEQLYAVLGELHVALLLYGEFVALLFHIGFCLGAKLIWVGTIRHCKIRQHSCNIGHSAFSSSCIIGHDTFLTY